MIGLITLAAIGAAALAFVYRMRARAAEADVDQLISTTSYLLSRELELKRALLRSARRLEVATDVIENAGCCMEEDGEVAESREAIAEFRAEARR